MGLSKTAKNKIVRSSHSSDFLEFIFDHSELNVSFTGIPSKNLLFDTEDTCIVNAVKQYLSNERFAFLEVNENTLGFGQLKLKLCGKKVEFLLDEDLQLVPFKERKVYMPNENDLVLWTIVNAKEDFDIEKIKTQIQIENAGLKNLN